MFTRQSIVLSFFELNNQDFTFTVYRTPYVDRRELNNDPGLSRYRLPTGDYDHNNRPIYDDFWVSLEFSETLEAYECSASTCNPLTRLYLFNLLKNRCELALTESKDYTLGDEKYRVRRIEFTIDNSFVEGNQVVWIEPYYLKSSQRFGFLADFKFRRDKNAPFNIEVQKHSLSLDKAGSRNKNFYSDRFNILRTFVAKYSTRVFDLSANIGISRHCYRIGHRMLHPKRYRFAENNVTGSQFMGMKEYGPFTPVQHRPKVYFVYRSEDHSVSQELYLALNGKTHSRTFPGMRRMFKYQFDRENVGGIEIQDFTLESVEAILESIRRQEGDRPIVPLFVSPLAEDSSEYYEIKRRCLIEKIPCQFVSVDLIRDPLEFKWAVSNIALQLFSKMGGIPWIVQPKTRSCLIVGIGQAHQRTGDGHVNKYFAYTVLTESSGLYKELKVLGNTADSAEYLHGFRSRLRGVLEKYYDDYDSFVIHTAFTLRRSELDAVNEFAEIEDVLKDFNTAKNDKKAIVVLKFNRRNKFFAYSEQSNSRIPFESTCIRLAHDEFLIWFEGLQYHRPTVSDRIEQPMHVQFTYENHPLDESKRLEYLQDAVNLSGANWRGFNAKSVPVSVKYADLVAKFYKEFQSLNGTDIDFETLRPWFL